MSKKGFEQNECLTVVIDCGTSVTRSGFGGDSSPISTISTVVGHPRTSFQNIGSLQALSEGMNLVIGAPAYKRAGYMSLRSPLENRLITNFDEFTSLITYVYNTDLHVSPDKHPLVMSLQTHQSKEEKEKLLEVVMETFRVPAFYAGSPAALALYSYGTTSGIVVDAGEGGTCVMPVFECFSMPYFSEIIDIGGKHVTDWLKRQLAASSNRIRSDFERDVLRDVKEQYCYVSKDIEKEVITEKTIVNPDGTEMKITKEQYMTPEVLFQPSLIFNDAMGTSKIVEKVIGGIDPDIRGRLMSTILTVGGTSNFPGYRERIESDLQQMTGDSGISIVAPVARRIASWLGGSILACTATFPQLCISSEEYEEEGPSIFTVKCY